MQFAAAVLPTLRSNTPLSRWQWSTMRTQSGDQSRNPIQQENQCPPSEAQVHEQKRQRASVVSSEMCRGSMRIAHTEGPVKRKMPAIKYICRLPIYGCP